MFAFAYYTNRNLKSLSNKLKVYMPLNITHLETANTTILLAEVQNKF